jgi:hypothetical protein
MPRIVVALLFAPLLAVAAPVPKPTEKDKIEAKFGKIVDPKGDSKFALDGDALKITLPAGEERRFGYTEEQKGEERRFDHTPKVTFSQTGDFILTVRVVGPTDDEAGGFDGRGSAYAGGGVLVVPKGSEGCRLGMVRGLKKGDKDTTFPFESKGIYTQGFGGGAHKSLTSETNWLRLTRTGKDLICEASADGKEWVPMMTFLSSLGDDTAAVSLYAQHGSDKAHTVTFDQFSVETPKVEKK